MIVKPGQVTTISCDFEKWTLDDPNPGRKEFFAEVMSALENNESGYATFSVGVPMEQGVGGYFTNTLNLDQINLPSIAVADPATMTIRFKDEDVDPEFLKENPDYEPITKEKAFAIFVHEACHFLHFSRDQGEFISPLMKGKSYSMEQLIHSPKIRREAEFEAGYRSIRYNALLRLYPEGDRTVLETNLSNMLNYDKKSQTKEWFEKYEKIVEPWLEDAKDENGQFIVNNKGKVVKSNKIAEAHKKDYEDFMNSIFAKVQKFTEWADPKHEVPGIMDYELPEKPVEDQDLELEKAIALVRSRGFNITSPGGTMNDLAPMAQPPMNQTNSSTNDVDEDENEEDEDCPNDSSGGEEYDINEVVEDDSDPVVDLSSGSPTANNVTIEIIDNLVDTKRIIGILKLDMTDDEIKDLKQAYKDSAREEEAVFDRSYNTRLSNLAEQSFNIKYGHYDFGDVVIKYASGRTSKIKNPWC